MTLSARLALALLVASTVAGMPAPLAAVNSDVAPAKAEQLVALYEAFWEDTLRINPIRATQQGDQRYRDQLPDYYSAAYREQVHDYNQRWLQRAEAIGPAGLAGQDLLSYEIFVRKRKNALEAEQFPDWMQPVHQFVNQFLLTGFVQLGSGTGAQPFKTVEDYDAWLARGRRLPALVESTIASMRSGMQAGVVQPRLLMVKVLPQLDALIQDKPEDTLFWGPIKQIPEDFSEADKIRLTAAYRDLIRQQLLPAYRELRAFIADEYMPRTRATAGLGALPNGRAWYAFNTRNMTTTDRSPEAIHALGMSEVARIHGEIRKVMAEVGFQDSLQAFFVFMRTDPRFTYANEDALLTHYRGLDSKLRPKLPALFNQMPKAAFEIRPVEAHRAKSASGGQYVAASEDGTRPGIFYINTFDLPSRKTWSAEATYLHEAMPGHYFEIELARERAALPKFRRFVIESAFSEGWGLYAESLGRPLGLYTDPYSYFGRLQMELWRAVRLVVDTGLHAKGWNREQVLDYMLENSAVSETDAISETERFMAWPGQALAYKVGELKIQELRDKAERELGDGFDIRRFHAEVLKDGSVPLDVLEGKIDRWIAAEKARRHG